MNSRKLHQCNGPQTGPIGELLWPNAHTWVSLLNWFYGDLINRAQKQVWRCFASLSNSSNHSESSRCPGNSNRTPHVRLQLWVYYISHLLYDSTWISWRKL